MEVSDFKVLDKFRYGKNGKPKDTMPPRTVINCMNWVDKKVSFSNGEHMTFNQLSEKLRKGDYIFIERNQA